jgi:hypothetical protein
VSLNQLVAEFSFCTPSAPPLTYTFKLTWLTRNKSALRASYSSLGVIGKNDLWFIPQQ